MNIIRKRIMLILSLAILATMNYMIYEKEQIKANGETLLLKLGPIDPRSIMQGDYMRLRYEIASRAPIKSSSSHFKTGYMVIKPDEYNVAQFVRFYDNRDLESGEKLLRFRKKGNRIEVMPDSFLFQEGQAEQYQQAKYGVFKFDDSGNRLLVGLADENRKKISPL